MIRQSGFYWIREFGYPDNLFIARWDQEYTCFFLTGEDKCYYEPEVLVVSERLDEPHE